MDISTPLSSSPLYPMLISALMMQNFTPQTESSFKNEYDYVIVGAGSAGSVLASRLSKNPSVSVLLLEAGDSPPPITEVPAVANSFIGSRIDWIADTVPQKNLDNRLTNIAIGKTVGGSSILNFMFNIRGNRKDYDDWASDGAEGWDYNNVLKYFKKLESYKVSKFYNDDYHGLNGPVTIELPNYEEKVKNTFEKAAIENGFGLIDPNAASQKGFYDVTANTRRGRRCSAAKAYLLDKRPNLDIVANAFVNRIILKNKRAVGVRVEFQGRNYIVEAKREVIVSAGAIHSPQLLMLSGIGPKDHLDDMKIPVVADLPVGESFHSHTLIPQVYSVSKDIPTFFSSLKNETNIKSFINDGIGILSSTDSYFISAFVTTSSNASPNSEPDIQFYFTYGNAISPDSTQSAITCVASPLRPLSRGSIKLNSTDPKQRPLVDPNFFDNAEDFQDAVQGMKFCNNFMALKIFQDIDAQRLPYFHKYCSQYEIENEYLTCLLRKSTLASHHPVGSVKMGSENDPTTVLDPQLRVKGIECLRVVDASVMPKIISGNTNIPTIMIAEKASDLIKSDNTC